MEDRNKQRFSRQISSLQEIVENFFGKVLFDFAAQAPNQINLKVGQVITLLQFGGAGGWSQGVEFGSGKSGYFPSDYVQVIQKVAAKAAPPPPVPPPVVKKPAAKLTAKALYDFAGSGPNEMSFKVGEIIEVLERGPPGAWSKVMQRMIDFMGEDNFTCDDMIW